ncbi:hypothetical protein SDC9_190199 [bioreactor metagenome]|uniref:Uncharacterized protein n=1 Tax=bioreactor metagenome TaxID=1076179 RepID=A0A645HVZ8_9ZZZZ
MGLVDGVHLGEILHRGKIDVDFDHVVERKPGFGQYRRQVVQDLTRLPGHASLGQFSGCGIERSLTGEKQQVSSPDGLRIWAHRFGSVRAADDFTGHLGTPYGSIFPAVIHLLI